MRFAVRWGEVEGKRLGADFYAPHLRAVDDQLKRAHFSVVPLGEICLQMGGGATPHRQDEAQYAAEGIKFLRIQNVTEHGLSFDDVKFITEETHANLLKRSQLQAGDVLMTITGRIGTAAVVREADLPANINQHIVQLRLDQGRITPDFLATFLNSDLGLQLTARSVTGTTRLALDYGAVRNVPIPLPPLDIQSALVADLDAARTLRRERLSQADELLSSLDGWLLDRLGLQAPQEDKRASFAVTLGQMSSDKRLNPNYYHPERIIAIREQKARASVRSEKLSAIADFIRDQKSIAPDDFYLGLANVASNTGELVDSAEEVAGTVSSFQSGDVLFARLRPYLNKVHRAERGGVCSPEFHVIRIRPAADPEQAVLPDYLATILRSSLVLAQTRHMMTGNTHPRLANDDVVNLVVTIPKIEIQQSVADEVIARREKARRLRADAQRDWDAAKARFEATLLGSAPVQVLAEEVGAS